MPRSFTTGVLMLRAKRLADMESSSFVSDDEWRAYLSESYARLYNRLMTAGIAPLESIQTITANGLDIYALPIDWLGTARVDYMESGTRPIPLTRISVREEHRWDTQASTNQAAVYRIAGAYLKILPRPGGGTYRHTYIPAPIDLDQDADVVDGVSGFERLLVLEAAMEARIKEESETADLRNERDAMLAEIDDMAKLREWGEPSAISDGDPDVPFLEGDYFPRRGIR